MKPTTTLIALLCATIAAHAGEENLPGIAAQPASYFYTGKPYDCDLDAYAFAFRSYDPVVARWTSTDPSGFPDGANNSFYAPSPTTGLDANGLAKVTVTGTTKDVAANPLGFFIVNKPKQTGNGIAAEMKVRWKLNTNITGSGWVIQEINITKSVFNADGTAATPAPFTPHYWEAWQVVNGTIMNGEDRMFFGPHDYHHGTLTTSGLAGYFTDDQVVANRPDAWSTTDVIESGGLFSTTNKPNWWNGGGGVTHQLKLHWE